MQPSGLRPAFLPSFHKDDFMTESVVAKHLPVDITAYDLVKAFAVIIMIIDHTGHYFFPDDLWWRAVGRIGFPVWFFLAGYATGKEISPRLVWGSLILLGANIVVGLPLLPLCALVTIILIRLLMDRVMEPVLAGKISIWVIAIAMLVLVIPTNAITEYGSQAFITAMFGYLVRHRKELPNETYLIRFMIFALLSFVIMQQLYYGFTVPQFMFMIMGTMLIRLWLYNFEGKETYPRLSQKLPAAFKFPITFMGRHTLEIYVVHLIVFKASAMMIGMDGYGLFSPTIWK